MKRSPSAVAHLVSLAAAMLLAAGCFYPPVEKPPRHNGFQMVLDLPYDLAWQAAHKVITNNSYRITAENPNRGVIEVEDGRFTLKDADCGEVTGLSGKIVAEPGEASTTVYNFHLAPAGPETSLVAIQATFRAPIQVPLHPARSVLCLSSGRQERRLMNQIRTVAATLRRPAFKHPAPANSSAPDSTGPGA